MADLARAVERDGELLLELAEDLEREGCPCGQRLPRCGHLIALARAAAFFCEAPAVASALGVVGEQE